MFCDRGDEWKVRHDLGWYTVIIFKVTYFVENSLEPPARGCPEGMTNSKFWVNDLIQE